jgi:phosphoribosylamine--glycine ligase
MKVLVVGGGGREHVIAWKIAQSTAVEKVYCVPGNPGIAQIADCRSIPLENNFAELADFAETEGIDLAVVGPEDPLANGLVDVFHERGLRAFGPNRKAAILEASKDFAKQLMVDNNIPTAAHHTFDNPDAAIAYLKGIDTPVFVKADGLAAGKGAIRGQTPDEAIRAVEQIMVDRTFGSAGSKVVIEELLVGEEASFTVLTDGEYCVPLVSSQDHKPELDGDRGKNTGGMGAYSPAPAITPEIHTQVMNTVVHPTIRAMTEAGRPFKGVLYVGLMISGADVKVLEFNCRFGDPEAQVLLTRMGDDLVPLLDACVDGGLDEIQVEWKPGGAVCVVMASGGYPDAYEKGKAITGLEAANALDGITVFHAGTKAENGHVVTNGGRVLGVTALASDVRGAIDRAYHGVAEIHFDRAHYRKDIGHRVLGRDS